MPGRNLSAGRKGDGGNTRRYPEHKSRVFFTRAFSTESEKRQGGVRGGAYRDVAAGQGGGEGEGIHGVWEPCGRDVSGSPSAHKRRSCVPVSSEERTGRPSKLQLAGRSDQDGVNEATSEEPANGGPGGGGGGG